MQIVTNERHQFWGLLAMVSCDIYLSKGMGCSSLAQQLMTEESSSSTNVKQKIYLSSDNYTIVYEFTFQVVCQYQSLDLEDKCAEAQEGRQQ